MGDARDMIRTTIWRVRLRSMQSTVKKWQSMSPKLLSKNGVMSANSNLVTLLQYYSPVVKFEIFGSTLFIIEVIIFLANLIIIHYYIIIVQHVLCNLSKFHIQSKRSLNSNVSFLCLA